MVVGFTGSRQGLTVRQLLTLRAELEAMDGRAMTFLHGDCIGADALAHDIALRLGWRIEIHPSNLESQRARCQAPCVYEPLPPLERNRIIVDRCEFLIACPAGPESRSGTWSTIRFAREVKRKGRIVWPDGSTSPV